MIYTKSKAYDEHRKNKKNLLKTTEFDWLVGHRSYYKLYVFMKSPTVSDTVVFGQCREREALRVYVL